MLSICVRLHDHDRYISDAETFILERLGLIREQIRLREHDEDYPVQTEIRVGSFPLVALISHRVVAG